jgi:hypothetical protein
MDSKYERMAARLRETVAGQTDDPEHLLDVLIAAWDEMHREAATRREIDASRGLPEGTSGGMAPATDENGVTWPGPTE